METHLDYLILHQLNHWVTSSKFLTGQAIFLNDSGFSELLIALTVVALWFLKGAEADQNAKICQRILLMFFALVPTYILARLLQSVVHRSRPIIDVALVIPKDLELWHSGQVSFSHFWGSFPSDHEALFFIFAIGFFTINKPLGILTFLFSLYYGVMRVSVGYLWPSDILGGAILGSLVMLLMLSLKSRSLISNALEYLLLQFKHYPAWLYTASFLFLSDFQQDFLFLKKISSLVFHQRLFH
ncbi:MAG: phosphatase PAP2 family protein [Chroococcidiopsidaceae cyanobacterium CP_BM_ER_R8_30]|nr:phosphatase PAP2 family protein [Chroococcidiopsidaceae cyanobacterium CP_BM_ER_R8_30]